jgi:hypothetical protein
MASRVRGCFAIGFHQADVTGQRIYSIGEGFIKRDSRRGAARHIGEAYAVAVVGFFVDEGDQAVAVYACGCLLLERGSFAKFQR